MPQIRICSIHPPCSLMRCFVMLSLFLQVVLLQTFLIVVHHVSPRNVESVSVSAVFELVKSKTSIFSLQQQ